jgi:ATP-dependent Clp protease adaptor protein ClpS
MSRARVKAGTTRTEPGQSPGSCTYTARLKPGTTRIAPHGFGTPAVRLSIRRRARDEVPTFFSRAAACPSGLHPGWYNGSGPPTHRQMSDNANTPKTGGEVKERTRTETKEPSMWKVVLLNDDYTPMEFVVHLLESVYDKGPAEAYRIMMQVHTQGRGLCGVYPFDVAETRVAATEQLAETAGFPLKAVMEEE